MKDRIERSRAQEFKPRKILTDKQRELMGDFTSITRNYIVAAGRSMAASQLDTTDNVGPEIDADKLRVDLFKSLVNLRGGNFSRESAKKLVRVQGKLFRDEKTKSIVDEIITKINTGIDDYYKKTYIPETKNG